MRLLWLITLSTNVTWLPAVVTCQAAPAFICKVSRLPTHVTPKDFCLALSYLVPCCTTLEATRLINAPSPTWMTLINCLLTFLPILPIVRFTSILTNALLLTKSLVVVAPCLTGLFINTTDIYPIWKLTNLTVSNELLNLRSQSIFKLNTHWIIQLLPCCSVGRIE
jgi:hypothetical protein